MTEEVVYAPNEQAMLELGEKLAQTKQVCHVIYLQGELGMGKTTLVRGFLRGLGYQGFVKSPTFTVVESYDVSPLTVHHFDLYRITDGEELAYIGLRDFLQPSAICLFEWPEKAWDELPSPDLTINIEQEHYGRKLTLRWHISQVEL